METYVDRLLFQCSETAEVAPPRRIGSTSLASTDATANSTPGRLGAGETVDDVPSKCSIRLVAGDTPTEPTAHTSLAANGVEGQEPGARRSGRDGGAERWAAGGDGKLVAAPVAPAGPTPTQRQPDHGYGHHDRQPRNANRTASERTHLV